MLIIDRIEENIASIECGGKVFNVPADVLPKGAKEGDVLNAVADDKNGHMAKWLPPCERPKNASETTPVSFVVDKDETDKRSSAISDLMDDLFV